jgi:hypothetical protein
MKTVRKILANKFFILSMASSIFVVSCKKQVIATHTKQESNTSDVLKTSLDANLYSGEEMFRHILLLEKNTKAKDLLQYRPYLAMLNGLTPDQKAARNLTCDHIISEINALDANYFDDFRNVIIGDDPYLIEAELRSAADLILLISSMMPGKGPLLAEYKTIAENIGRNYNLSDESDVERFKVDATTLLSVNFPEYQGIAASNSQQAQSCLLVVAIVALAVVGVVVAVIDGLWVKSFYGDKTGTTDLKNDQLVLSIIQRY